MLYKLGFYVSAGMGLDRREVWLDPSIHRLDIPPMNCSDIHPGDGCTYLILSGDSLQPDGLLVTMSIYDYQSATSSLT